MKQVVPLHGKSNSAPPLGFIFRGLLEQSPWRRVGGGEMFSETLQRMGRCAKPFPHRTPFALHSSLTRWAVAVSTLSTERLGEVSGVPTLPAWKAEGGFQNHSGDHSSPGRQVMGRGETETQRWTLCTHIPCGPSPRGPLGGPTPASSQRLPSWSASEVAHSHCGTCHIWPVSLRLAFASDYMAHGQGSLPLGPPL